MNTKIVCAPFEQYYHFQMDTVHSEWIELDIFELAFIWERERESLNSSL